MLRIEKVWIASNAVWIRTTDGQEACEYFDDYTRLKYATKDQRENFISDDFGITWPDLDEDLSYEGFFKPKNKTELYRVFIEHPELNVSAIARRMGISQSLFAQYISGLKKPSKERLDSIYATLREIGQELIDIFARGERAALADD